MGNWTLKLTVGALAIVALMSCSKLGFEGSKTAKAVRTTHMLFGCLTDTDGGGPLGDVVYNKNTATISMNWKLARGANGDVRYTVSELGTGEVLKITSDNSFELKVNPAVPQTYTLLVEAEDKDGQTSCGSQEKYVQVGVANTEVPTMGRSWAFATAQNMILVVWEKSPSATAAQYKVYRAEDVVGGNGFNPIANPTPLKSTAFTFAYIENLTPNSTYRFIVEVADTDGNQSQKKAVVTATTDFIQRPPFYGLFDVRKVGGIAGLESLDLYFTPTTDSAVTGYQVFIREGAPEYDLGFNAAYTQVAPVDSVSSVTAGPYTPRSVSGVVTEHLRVNGLISGRTYCFVVRAFKDGNPVNNETNRLSFCKDTNTIKAPTFTGVGTVAASPGAAGFSSLDVTYPPAATDGVMNKWEISYVGFATDPGSCAAVSFNGAYIYKTASEADLATPIGGGNVIAGYYYCVRVRTLYENGPIYLTDTNDVRKKARAWPEPPVFLGISSIVRATTANGESFDTAFISYPAATGSFSRYRIQVATDVNFTSLVAVNESSCKPTLCDSGGDKSVFEVDQTKTTRSLSGLPKKTVLYFRVTAEFNNANPAASLNDAADHVPPYSPKKLAMDTTPTAPTNDGVSQLNVVNPATLQVIGVPATNAGATWSHNKVWIVREDTVPGKTAEQAILDYRLHPEWLVTPDLSRNTFDTTITGLTAGKRYCVQFRSEYEIDPDSLLSSSTRTAICQTPSLLAASFNGVNKVYDKNDVNGWDQLQVEWVPLTSKNNFEKYVVTWSDVDAKSADFVTNRKEITNWEQSTTNISGMSPNKTMFVRVRVENSFSGQQATPTGGATPANAQASPKAPSGGSIVGSSAGATTIKLDVVASENPDNNIPGNPNQKTGLWNTVFFYLAKTDAAVVNGLMKRGVNNTRIPAYIPASGDIDYVMPASGQVTLGAGVDLDTGVIIRADRGNPIQDGPTKNTLYIKSVPPGQYQIYMRQAYWTGDTDRFVQNGSYFIGTAQPQAQAPDFNGIKGFSIFHDSNDFMKLNPIWDAAKGECTRMEVIAYKVVPGTFDWKNPVVTSDCTETNKAVAVDYLGNPLASHEKYKARVRALNQVLTTPYTSGDMQPSGERLLTPDPPGTPTFDGDPNLTLTVIPKSKAKIKLAWTNPTTGDFNRIFVFSNVIDETAPAPISADAQRALLQNALETKSDFTGPKDESLAIQEVSTSAAGAAQTWTNIDLLAGNRYCYAVVSVYDNRGVGASTQYYISNVTNKTDIKVGCKSIPYNPPDLKDLDFTPSFSASNCSDGTKQIFLPFPAGSTVSGVLSVDKWQVFVSDTPGSFGDLTMEAWQEIDYGDPQDQSGAATPGLLVGCKGKTIAGNNHFLVRWNFEGGVKVDSAVNRYNITPFNVPVQYAHWVRVKKAFSGLPYDYLLGAYEASALAGSFVADSVSTSNASLVSCGSRFHKDGNYLGLIPGSSISDCGASTSTQTVVSVKNATPLTANFAQAYWACRHSSTTGFHSRLATRDEWYRAAKPPSNGYATMWNVYSHSTVPSTNDCNSTSGNPIATGSRANCKSFVNAFDMAGNVREWVDARLMPYTVSDSEKRFNYKPTIGLMVNNGIDQLTYRYHFITPPAGGVALLMGSDYQTGSDSFFPASGSYYQKQFDVGTQYWADPAVSNAATGFRCVAFLETARSTADEAMDQFALPREPAFVASDNGGTIANWKIPENLYVKDAKIESVTHSVTDSTAPAAPSGSITFTWSPWTKPCLGASCPITYDIYRFVAPVFVDARPVIPWALTGGAYASNKPLDPLAVDASGTPIYSSEKILSNYSCTSAPCTFTDSTLNPQVMYKYLIVGVDGNGGAMPGRIQKMRTPYMTGDRSLGATATFRDEYRFRDAGIYPLATTFQSGQTINPSQAMAYVPMDKSGLDHDFYIQKYEAALAGSLIVDNSAGSANYPRAATSGSSNWVSEMASCQEELRRNGTFNSDCGAVTGTTASTKSAKGITIMGGTNGVGVTYSALFAACRNSVIPGGLYDYALNVAANSQWVKAADWGDLDHNNLIDVGPMAGSNVSTLQGGGAPGCVTDNLSDAEVSGNRSGCVSRYGGYDFVGNGWEMTAGRVFGSATLDDGMSGLELGVAITTSNFYLNGVAGLDLWRGVFSAAGNGATLTSSANDQVIGVDGTLDAPVHGGANYNGSGVGRFTTLYPSGMGPNFNFTKYGGRCAYP